MDRGLYLVVQTRPSMRALYSVPVRHPVLSWYLASARTASFRSTVTGTPVAHTATPFASIRLGLRLAKCIGNPYTFDSLLRTRAVPGTHKTLERDRAYLRRVLEDMWFRKI